MKSIVEPNCENLNIACDILSQGGVVAIPTETVYGLAGDSTNPYSISNIYNIKNRPKFNPLISHCDSIEMVEKIAIVNDVARKLFEKFSPGEITLVLQRSKNCPVSSIACAGLDTIAVRIPNHKTSLNLISQFGKPLCAPSANKSGGISPTRANHVYDSLGDKVEMILDGGLCTVGIESTIVDVSGSQPTILRAGGITVQEIENVIGVKLGEKTFAKGNNPIAPGQLKSHYAPDIPLYMNILQPFPNHAYIGFGNCEKCDINLSEKGDLVEAGSKLFDVLHTLNNMEYSGINIAPIPNEGVGVAINDKLIRASVNNKY